MNKKIQILLLIILINPLFLLANTWSVHPWSLKTEGNIKIKSIPYRIYQGGKLGITKVYKGKSFLYSIEDYFSTFITINKTGEYLVSINFNLSRKGEDIIEIDEYGNRISKEKFEGDAIKIFKNGKLIKTIDFSELRIDTSKLIKKVNRFYWQTKDKKINKCPAIIKDDILKIATIDNQILNINLINGQQLDSEVIRIGKIIEFVNLTPKRRLKVRKKFPKNLSLPRLVDGRTIEEALSQYMNLDPSDSERDNAIIEIYFHTLLINREGRYEKCFVSLTKRESLEVEFGFDRDFDLEKKIKNWISEQYFETKSIPKYTDKYVFSDFIYLKNKKVINNQ